MTSMTDFIFPRQKFEKQCQIGTEILKNCRNEWYGHFPYLDGAFASVAYAPVFEGTVETDGDKFYFFPEFLLKMYVENPAAVRRGYLHMLLHCLYLHPFRERPEDEQLWNMACDMSVARLFHRMSEERRISQDQEEEKRAACLNQLGGEFLSPEQFYEALKEKGLPLSWEEMLRLFVFDDHTLWKQSHISGSGKMKEKWKKILAYTSQNKKSPSAKPGTVSGTGSDNFENIRKSRYDYRKCLRRFSVPGEEMELDTESFDYIFYYYGLERYGNMPLLEPLEYKEVNRLEELVIAIDTSGSCSREMVQQFLAETYGILSEKENFFRKMVVYLVQCDCCIQSVQIIHSREEWEEYSKNITIQGRGGTDFTPVFRMIEQEKSQGRLRRLRALIYFTDGDGVYPQEKPGYETAFVFLGKEKRRGKTPPWALELEIPFESEEEK